MSRSPLVARGDWHIPFVPTLPWGRKIPAGGRAVPAPLPRRVCGVGLERREVGRQVCGLYLEESLRLAQAAEPMRAQAPEADAGWARPAPRLPGGGREADLAPRGDPADPRAGGPRPNHVDRVGPHGGPPVDAAF